MNGIKLKWKSTYPHHSFSIHKSSLNSPPFFSSSKRRGGVALGGEANMTRLCESFPPRDNIETRPTLSMGETNSEMIFVHLLHRFVHELGLKHWTSLLNRVSLQEARMLPLSLVHNPIGLWIGHMGVQSNS